MSTNTPLNQDSSANADPLTGQPGAHPVATGVGAAAVGAAGLAAAAVVAGPVGIAVAAIGGAFIGGYVGKAAGEIIDPTAEEAFWREAHAQQEFVGPGEHFNDYAPAYRSGFEGYHRHIETAKTFEEAEPQIRAAYEANTPAIPWEKARAAAQAAWTRVHRGEAHKPTAEISTGVSAAVLGDNAKTGILSDAQMPR